MKSWIKEVCLFICFTSCAFLTGCENPDQSQHNLDNEPTEVSTEYTKSDSGYKMFVYLRDRDRVYEINNYLTYTKSEKVLINLKYPIEVYCSGDTNSDGQISNDESFHPDTTYYVNSLVTSLSNVEIYIV
jgi:hypothetical protein